MEESNILIPEGWERVKFSEYISFQEGPGLMSFLFREVGFPFINIRCIENGKINKESCQFLSEEIAQNQYKHFQLEENDLIVSTSGTLGKKAFVKKSDLPLLLNTSIIRFKPKDTDVMSLNFLNFLLEDNSFLYNLYSQSTGSAQVNVGPTHLKKLFITIPKTSKEQNKIAEILSKVDKAISETEIIIAKYNRIKTGLIQDLLTKGTDEEGNIRNEKTHKFKDSPLGRIPNEWSCKTIDDISERLRSGVTPKGGSNVYQEEGIMLIRSQNVYPYGFKLNDVAYINDEINIRMLGSQLNENDVLLNITGASIGRATYVPNNFPKANVNQHVCAIRLKDSNSSKAIFLSVFLNSIYGQNQIYQNINGSNREGINYTQIKEIKLPSFNSDRELEMFINMIFKINTKIESEEIKLAKLKSTKTGLMQDLLSGKKRVTHLIN
ncbi:MULTISPECIES: restriction endonuclease subunit S [Sphingobacterium]|uniref:restriction endonuclease subunit S n=1 Tax=Sphingobacterium TaxID=28453 RepID=UPI001044399E|nr:MULTISPECIES: restriction endonuclease subunit S [Sphingobacterium]MCW2258678.1 type I restriction enzyme S subunit [Sphingobacterium kitahiroshimense]TCR14866.1 type I restriction enzyme S subunit [Sphingobacterium sp. JUb78]